MKRVIVECGCSKVIETKDIDDGQAFSTVYVLGECIECTALGGHYQRSSSWQEGKQMPLEIKLPGVIPIETKADKRRKRK